MVKENTMKQTEIGLLPDDWEVVYWTDVFDFKSTSSYSRAEINETGIFGYFHYGDIHTKIGSLLNPNVYVSGFIDKSQLKNYTLIKKGDLIIADASEDYSGVGKGFEVIDEPNIPTISGLHTFLVREKKEGTFAYRYKGYFHFNEIIKKQYDNLATGLKVYSLSKGSFKNIQIPLPSLPEQEAIAEALSDADAWIESLEQLIAKKRLIKQGVMQELLSPKEDWEVKKLGEVCEYRNGKALESFFNNLEGFKVISIGNYSLQSKYKSNSIYISKEYKSKLIPYIVKAGELTMILNDKTASGEIIGRTLLIETDDDFIINQRSIILKPNENIVKKEYLYFFINCDTTRNEIFNEAKPGTQIYINTSDVLNLKLTFPKSLTEQTRIATILSDMDAELEALEQQLHKARQIKQGMMQELLTGRIRLLS